MRIEEINIGDKLILQDNRRDRTDTGWVNHRMTPLIGKTVTVAAKTIAHIRIEEDDGEFVYHPSWFTRGEEVRNGRVLRLIRLKSGKRARRWVLPTNPNIVSQEMLQLEALQELLTQVEKTESMWGDKPRYALDNLYACCGADISRPVLNCLHEAFLPTGGGMAWTPQRVEWLWDTLENALQRAKDGVKLYKDSEYGKRFREQQEMIEGVLNGTIKVSTRSQLADMGLFRTVSHPSPMTSKRGLFLHIPAVEGDFPSPLRNNAKWTEVLPGVWGACVWDVPKKQTVVPNVEVPEVLNRALVTRGWRKEGPLQHDRTGAGIYQSFYTGKGTQRFHFAYGCSGFDTANEMYTVIHKDPRVKVGDSIAFILTDRQIDDDKAARLAAAGFERLMVTGNNNHPTTSVLYLYGRVVTEEDKKES